MPLLGSSPGDDRPQLREKSSRKPLNTLVVFLHFFQRVVKELIGEQYLQLHLLLLKQGNAGFEDCFDDFSRQWEQALLILIEVVRVILGVLSIVLLKGINHLRNMEAYTGVPLTVINRLYQGAQEVNCT